ncbi:hypothetical protein EP7_002143 [Isosphaeraceae bacterium EP7]
MVYTTRNVPNEMLENRPARLWVGLAVSASLMVLTLGAELAIYLKHGQTEWQLLPIGAGLSFFALIYLTIRGAMMKMHDL